MAGGGLAAGRRIGVAVGYDPAVAFKDLFSFLFQRSSAEEHVARYVVREHERGRSLDEILQDRYVQNRLSPEQQKRLLDRPEIVAALANAIILLGVAGYVLIEAASGKVGPFRDVPQPDPDEDGMFPGVSRQDLHFNHDGTRLYVQQYARQGKKDYRDWYTLSGRPTSAPPAEKHAGRPQAGLSPDGRLLAADGDAKGSPVLDPMTGRKVAWVPSQEQLAWADSKRIIALACADPARCTGKNNDPKRLVLVTVDSKKAVPLTAARTAPQGYKRVWTPMLTAR